MPSRSLNFFLAFSAVAAAVFVAYRTDLLSSPYLNNFRRADIPNSCKQPNSIAITINGRGSDEALQNHVNQLANSNSKATFHVPAMLDMKPENASWYQALARVNHTVGLYWDQFDPSGRSTDDFEKSLRDCSEWMKRAVGEYPLFLRIHAPYDSDTVRQRAQELGFVQSTWSIDMGLSDCQEPPTTAAVNPTLSIFLENHSSQVVKSSFISDHPIGCFRYPSYAGILNSKSGAKGFSVVSLATCLDASGYDGLPYMKNAPVRNASPDSKVNQSSSSPSSKTKDKGAARRVVTATTLLGLAITAVSNLALTLLSFT